MIIKIYIIAANPILEGTGWSISYRTYIRQIKQPSRYRYAKLQYRFAVISGSPNMYHFFLTRVFGALFGKCGAHTLHYTAIYIMGDPEVTSNIY